MNGKQGMAKSLRQTEYGQHGILGNIWRQRLLSTNDISCVRSSSQRRGRQRKREQTYGLRAKFLADNPSRSVQADVREPTKAAGRAMRRGAPRTDPQRTLPEPCSPDSTS